MAFRRPYPGPRRIVEHVHECRLCKEQEGGAELIWRCHRRDCANVRVVMCSFHEREHDTAHRRSRYSR